MLAEPHDFIHLQFRNSKADPAKIVNLYKKGLSLNDIEIQLGVSKSIARRILLDAQVPLRTFAKENPARANFLRAKRATKPPYGFWYIDGQVVRHPKEYQVLL